MNNTTKTNGEEISNNSNSLFIKICNIRLTKILEIYKMKFVKKNRKPTMKMIL
ncbi:hypothetical protein LEP1GSC049_3769 [Leptospira kirschneri serovar Cynopteri str. 3522 CT]|uniref:Uncharacterized protein n=1 Tax=Leptospira kirschneri str. 200802841 TaxID=1193047 RepID=A0A828Y0E9_9LEPT|nr:hypothetical protein LEP1GSC044_3368 [Leptospira kirschneri serovar Grippotyphosa str. RM52]EKO53425.1 hypothetical protein LEP1GSC131_3801 [Leptospira kirschneri str. 200802841]EKR09150.1 hypothetical protein LEP1GSC122_0797 [Leptospira kirschneri serovar Valbuzzi str. 200702274]EMK04291.1 hypothetical protein LEP1GSC176_1008 [Leptospira kirschneri str. MMD1493]EPG50367.1 hypothetical protein LEP1GSC049_3769 [Leptospira kirschneri serovar Cynopteri str. 3522 CT]